MESVDEVGASTHDFVLSIIFSIIILIMMFAFIFIGIDAFSPSSSFSSVINSSMPVVAGGTVSKGGNKDQQ